MQAKTTRATQYLTEVPYTLAQQVAALLEQLGLVAAKLVQLVPQDERPREAEDELAVAVREILRADVDELRHRRLVDVGLAGDVRGEDGVERPAGVEDDVLHPGRKRVCGHRMKPERVLLRGG